MIDFDAMVTKGIISQETRDAIKTYMNEHKPEGEMPSTPPKAKPPLTDRLLQRTASSMTC